MKRILHLQEHKHTARRLAHSHTSYRSLVVVLFVFGLCLVGIRHSVYADSYAVNARIAAPLPSAPAEITSPNNGIIVGGDNIVLRGTCPVITPSIIVLIYRNNEIVGSAGCSNTGQFLGTFNIVAGDNVFKPQVVTITNDYGLEGVSITISKTVSVTPAGPQDTTVNNIAKGQTSSQPKILSQSSDASTDSTANFTIKTEKQFLIFTPGESFTWKINIDGGQSPYTVIVDWGDGTHSTYAANSSGDQNLSHIYKSPKNTVVKIRVKDSNGKEVYTTVAGVTFRAKANNAAVNGSVSNKPVSGNPFTAVWLTYATVVLAIVLLWLHSRHRQLIIRIRKNKSKVITRRQRRRT